MWSVFGIDIIFPDVFTFPKQALLGFLLICGNIACGTTLHSVSELDDFLNGSTQPRTEYGITGTVVQQFQKGIVLEESGIFITIPHTPRPLPDVGTRIRLRGTAAVLPSGEPTVYGDQTFEVIGRGIVPTTVTNDLEHIDIRRMNQRTITTQGHMIGYLNHEIDPEYVILLIRKGLSTCPVFILKTSVLPAVGSLLRVTGTFYRKGSGGRKFSVPFISTTIDQIEELEAAPTNPFDAPRLETQLYLTPEEVTRLGRRSVLGRVLATWDGEQLMIRSDADRIVNVRLLPNQPLPEPGTVITVVGQPETDLFQLNLAFGLWRPEPAKALPPEPEPEEFSLAKLFLNTHKQHIINYNFNGRRVRIEGQVHDISQSDGILLLFQLGADGQQIEVDCKNARLPPGVLEIGAKVLVTGYCRLETQNRGQNIYFPLANNQSIVIRTADDIVVLKNPPWWTPRRFLLSVIGLLAVLTCVFLWNLSLHVLVKRCNHQLFKAQFEKASSELRVDERTRLAVELHDSLAQNLASVSMEVTTALCMDKDRSEMMRHLTIADKGLKACCLDLRDTLWDLRSEALEEPTVERAIRKTLLPHLKSISLSLRFKVPRNRFSEKTLREVLCIIRELAVNGIRHGKATELRIAGAVEADTLRFSVKDNGCGFDASSAPGVDEGHFGLAGIRDRLRRINGTLSFDTKETTGAKAVVSIHISRLQNEKRPS